MSGYSVHDEVGRPVSVEPVKMVAVDLDGTLLRTDLAICARGAEALMTAAERGVKVVIATGRSPRETARFWRALGLDTPAVCHNGALICADPSKPEPLHHRPLPGELARQVVELAHRTAPDMAIGIEIIDRVFTRKDGLFERADLFDRSVTKVAMAGEPGPLADVQNVILTHFGRSVAFAPSTLRLIQVTHPEATKGDALARLAAHWQIPRESVMVVGDAPNDIPMFEWAGVAVATANGWATARQAAHVTVASNDDAGVAAAVERFVLR